MKSPIEVLRLYEQHDHRLETLYTTRMKADASRPFLQIEDRKWSWAEFHDAYLSLARALSGRGIERGDRFGVMARNSEAHVLLLFALARIGAILVPVNPEFGEEEALYVLDHAGVSAVACSGDTYEVASRAGNRLAERPWYLSIDQGAETKDTLYGLLNEDSDLELRDDISADDTCIIVYSSGTTGFPKGVMHSQRSYVLSGERHIARVHLQPDDISLCILPMFHINALFYSIAGTVAAGAALVIAARFSASRFWKLAAESRATQVNIIMAVGNILARRSRDEFEPGHRLRVVSGAPFSQETLDVFHKEFGIETVIEGFGMTEVPGAFSNPFFGPHKTTTMGKPGLHPDRDISWTETRVVDEHGNDLPDGQVGELLLRVPTLMQGYYRDPKQTKQAFRDGWFMTGDLVRVDEDGYYHFIARKKDIIRRRGENVAGAELDRVVGSHPGVAEAAAIPVDAELGEDEILVAVVPQADGSVSPQEILDWCVQRLARHKWPRYLTFVERLPHTASHKVAKFRLREDPSVRDRAIDLQALVPEKSTSK